MQQDDPRLRLFLANRSALVEFAAPIVGDRSTAEDIVQEAYLRFDAVGAARLIEEPLGYLYRIVRNLAVDGRRRRLREARIVTPNSADAGAQTPEDRPTPESEALARAELRIVAEAFAELPERTRTALEMHRLRGCKLREIAAHLGVSITAAHALVADGVAHCRRRLRTSS